LKVSNFTSSHYKTTSRTFTAEEQAKDFGIKLTAELPGILNWPFRAAWIGNSKA